MMEPLLKVDNLHTHFFKREGTVKAVNGLSFHLNHGETLAIVGESGSGKTISMLSLMGLIPSPPGKVVDGSAHFEGFNLIGAKASELRQYRGNKIGFIFQDPMTSLNPYLRISTQLTETVAVHNPSLSRHETRKRAIESLNLVGIPDAETRIDQYPHQFSGGMRQRVMIAMSLINNPKLLIADEPTTALDVTIQAQILDVLQKMQKLKGMSTIMITHDLGVVAGIADRVLVMYAGSPVEVGTVDEIFYEPKHPYTKALLHSMPRLSNTHQKLEPIPGIPPNLAKLKPGCAFAPRCQFAKSICTTETAIPTIQAGPQHHAICHLSEN